MSALSRRSAIIALALALSCLGALPAIADAAPSMKKEGGVVTVQTEGSDDYVFFENGPDATQVFVWTYNTVYPSPPGTGCAFHSEPFGVNSWKRYLCSGGPAITRIVVHGGDGDDAMGMWTGVANYDFEFHGGPGFDGLYGSSRADQLFGGDGGDYVDGGAGNDTLDGGADGDSLNGGEGVDLMRGGGDRDTFVGGPGADDMDGGDGFDIVYYYDKPVVSLSISLDGNANDGEVEADGRSKELDNVRPSVEDVFGGPGDDTITGSDVANELDGSDGNDVISGGDGIDDGTDRFQGGPGVDIIVSRDGNAERVECGDSAGHADTAKSDTVDEVSGCESNEASADLQPDQDNDGFLTPQDCNDKDRSINPGATDVPDDGIDQNCDQADAQVLDRDGDGFNKDVDCDDADKNSFPNGREVLGNAADENCDGFAPPIPVIETPVNSFFDWRGGVTYVLSLNVGEMEKGTRVVVRCKGGPRKGCPRKLPRARTVKRRTKGANFFKYFRNSRLKRGASIEVELTKPGYVGRLVLFKIKPKAVPTPRPLCINPGEKKAKAC